MKKKVILFKSESEDYARAFRAAGFEPTFVDALEYDFFGEDELDARLMRGDYCGLIFTSPRAVDAVATCWNRHKSLRELWAPPRRVYAVGEASGARVRRALGLEALGTTAGNARALVELVLAENDAGTFLFPGGDLRADTLERELRAGGLTVDALTVYSTRENSALERVLMEMVANGDTPNALVLFSPSGADWVLRRLGKAWETVPLVSIGPSTSARLRALRRPPAAEALSPCPQEAVCALQTYLEGSQ